MKLAVAVAAATLFAASLAGCAAVDRSLAITDQAVVPIANGEATYVAPSDLAEVMLQAGFTPAQILENGPSVGAAIATAGGAQVRQGSVVSALFSVQSGALIVTSLERGTFVRPLIQEGAR